MYANGGLRRRRLKATTTPRRRGAFAFRRCYGHRSAAAAALTANVAAWPFCFDYRRAFRFRTPSASLVVVVVVAAVAVVVARRILLLLGILFFAYRVCVASVALSLDSVDSRLSVVQYHSLSSVGRRCRVRETGGVPSALDYYYNNNNMPCCYFNY